MGIWFQIFLSRHEQFDKWLKQVRIHYVTGTMCQGLTIGGKDRHELFDM